MPSEAEHFDGFSDDKYRGKPDEIMATFIHVNFNCVFFQLRGLEPGIRSVKRAIHPARR